MPERGFVERVWYGGDAIASAARTALTPLERVFGGIVGARDILYDAGWLPAHETAIPAVSVGNLTVGGTGKTPIAAWIARGLADRGAHPAVVLRGYGDDEPLVHARLNPDVPVFVGADREAAVSEAARHGADIAVLDDAFQHRRVQRMADLVLVSADRWTADVRLLPAGPWREPLKAVRRATLVIVTRKAASDRTVEAVHEQIARIAPGIPRVSVLLDSGELVRADDPAKRRPLHDLDGSIVHAVLSIADPGAFIRQIERRGARVRPLIYPDHHAFTDHDVQRIAATFKPGDWIICTLKDAVKLAPTWPRLAPPLWYVSQQVMVERGVGGLERVLDDLVRARSRTSPTAG
ncbi:MAG: Tetraacyldisaccharide 4-kinase [Gemmatimonadetes bacterium]|nr:Tetraacyldisaccharide 4-kinase [Gemmatimonadota bacterium]